MNVKARWWLRVAASKSTTPDYQQQQQCTSATVFCLFRSFVCLLLLLFSFCLFVVMGKGGRFCLFVVGCFCCCCSVFCCCFWLLFLIYIVTPKLMLLILCCSHDFVSVFCFRPVEKDGKTCFLLFVVLDLCWMHETVKLQFMWDEYTVHW